MSIFLVPKALIILLLALTFGIMPSLFWGGCKSIIYPHHYLNVLCFDCTERFSILLAYVGGFISIVTYYLVFRSGKNVKLFTL